MTEKKHNRVLSLFLALLMCIELVPFTAFEVSAKINGRSKLWAAILK